VQAITGGVGVVYLAQAKVHRPDGTTTWVCLGTHVVKEAPGHALYHATEIHGHGEIAGTPTQWAGRQPDRVGGILER
jgi:hypothetical protein